MTAGKVEDISKTFSIYSLSKKLSAKRSLFNLTLKTSLIKSEAVLINDAKLRLCLELTAWESFLDATVHELRNA